MQNFTTTYIAITVSSRPFYRYGAYRLHISYYYSSDTAPHRWRSSRFFFHKTRKDFGQTLLYVSNGSPSKSKISKHHSFWVKKYAFLFHYRFSTIEDCCKHRFWRELCACCQVRSFAPQIENIIHRDKHLPSAVYCARVFNAVHEN